MIIIHGTVADFYNEEFPDEVLEESMSCFSYCNDNIAAIITNSIHLVVGLLDTPEEEEQDFMVRAIMALC